MPHPITRVLLDKAMSYTEYRKLMMKLTGEGPLTEPHHSRTLTDTVLENWHRMQELEKSASLNDETIDLLQSCERHIYMLVLAEAWCRDVAESLPILGMVTDSAPAIELGILLRDEHPEVMDAYLTRGSRSIPKVIFLDAGSLEELAVWGPRPMPAQKTVEKYLSENTSGLADLAKLTEDWYSADNGKTIENEISSIIRRIG